MPPLRFHPLFKQRPWGGERLARCWNKPAGAHVGWAESWEVVDLGTDQSRVLGGPFDGWALNQLVAEHSQELLGYAEVTQFPLLFKFLDAAQTLSVQVHPNDELAQRLAPGQRGKSEAWVVLAADPDSQLFVGLKPGVNRAALERHLAAGTVADCLQPFVARVGDVYSVPAGTVHAIGAGVSLAEIQQPSDLTLRLFDWNRLDANGQPRTLHVSEALPCIDFSQRHGGSVSPALLEGPAQSPASLETPFVRREELIRTEHFLWRRLTVHHTSCELPRETTCRVLNLIEGRARLTCDSIREQLHAGDTLVIPASTERATLEALPGCVLLEALPVWKR